GGAHRGARERAHRRGIESRRPLPSGALQGARAMTTTTHKRSREMRPFQCKVLTAVAVAMAVLPVGAQEKADVAAAEKEGKVSWYASVDVKVAEAVAEAFRKQYPKIEVEVERSGSERVFQRVNQEHESSIKHADIVNTSDSTHFIYWKQKGWL